MGFFIAVAFFALGWWVAMQKMQGVRMREEIEYLRGEIKNSKRGYNDFIDDDEEGDRRDRHNSNRGRRDRNQKHWENNSRRRK